MTVGAIVRQVLAGDRQAFRAVIEEYGPCVRAFIAAHLADAHTIDDLAQETFIAAFEGLAGFRPDGDFKAWIKGIARNKVLMHLRRAELHGSAMERFQARAAGAVTAELRRRAEPDRPDAVDRLRSCLDKLPGELRGIISARYYSREPVQAIAGRLGKSPAAVSSLLFRGRQLLASCIGRGS
jgi:RNA polymerase sigma-70 factor (ECF subfamily)